MACLIYFFSKYLLHSHWVMSGVLSTWNTLGYKKTHNSCPYEADLVEREASNEVDKYVKYVSYCLGQKLSPKSEYMCGR